MRYAIAAMLVFAELAWAQVDGTSDYTSIWDFYKLRPGITETRHLRCPSDSVPLYGVYPKRGHNVDIFSRVADASGNPLTLTSEADVGGAAGHIVLVTNRGTNDFHGSLYLHCARRSGLSANQFFQNTIQPGAPNFFGLSCPSPGVPVGYITDADGRTLEEVARAYRLGQAQTPQNALPDGVYGAPTALGVGFRNNTTAPIVLNGIALCAVLPNAQTHILSSPVEAGAPFVAFAPVPDGFNFVGNAFTVSGASSTNVTTWTVDGLVSDYVRAGLLQIRADLARLARGVYLDGRGNPPSSAKQQVIGRAIVALLLVPSTTPVPPPTIVPIVEFYHAGLDHYFITASTKEIADLDGGVHAGWQRTGETFNAYGPGSSGRTGRRPVCREYGNPAAGLDSHFYSASPQECVATLENFGDDWLPEAAEVFEMELPDTTTGACASDRVPIYRLWNGRADSSHRFVKTLALRAQMIARGFVSEGYGPNGVVFCALP